jgi:CRISPR/Cas system CSM-associated protein Csm3 (group 7 of RAMP superfamily)
MTQDDRAPKPYELVGLAHDARIERQAPVGHDAYRPDLLSGEIRLEVTALTPVHVASGLMELTDNTKQPLVRGLLRVGDSPVIPGSSLKGSIRAIFEAITPSCVRITRARELPRYMEGCRSKDNLCPGCRIFGAQDFQGLVRFGDLRQVAGGQETEKVPQFFKPRTRERLYVGGQYVRGRKFYMHGSQQASGNSPIEVCPVDSRFKGTITFVNMSQAQLGALLVALGQSREHGFVPKLGGAKPACFGSLRIGIAALTRNDPRQTYAAWDTGDADSLDQEALLGAAETLLLRPQLRQLAHVLRWPNERTCPEGNY